MSNRREFLAGAVATLGLTAAVDGPLGATSSSRPVISVWGSSEDVKWVSRPIREDAPNTLQAFLRRDQLNGLAVLVAFPPAWKTSEPVYYNSDEAIFVLDGDFGIGNHRLTTGQYRYLPYGMLRTEIASQTGCLVIAFFSHVSRHYHADTACPGSANRGLLYVDSWSISWQSPMLPSGFAGTILFKPIHSASVNVGLLLLAPGISFGAQHKAASWEEWFVLAGNLLVQDTRCGPGTYGFLVPGTDIGPICTESGALLLVRFPPDAQWVVLPSAKAEQAARDYGAGIRYVQLRLKAAAKRDRTKSGKCRRRTAERGTTLGRVDRVVPPGPRRQGHRVSTH